jgi:parvulin-like peptidyl-prolyl isomerase
LETKGTSEEKFVATLPEVKPRRQPEPLPPEDRPSAGRRFPILLLLAITLIVGIGLGGYIESRRVRARQMVAAVNGYPIYQDEFYRHLEQVAGPQVIKNWRDTVLRIQFAQSLGVAPSDQEVEQRYAEISKAPHFDQMLADRYETPDDVKMNLRSTLAQIAILTHYYGHPLPASAVEAVYKKNTDPSNPNALFYHPEQVQIAVIITKDKSTADKAYDALTSGASFYTVAKQYSQDISAQNGGLLPWMRKQGGSAPQALKDLIFSLHIDQTTTPHFFMVRDALTHQLRPTWWIIRMVGHTPASTDPFNNVKEQCELLALQSLLTPKQNAQYQKDFDAFKRKARLQAFWPRYQAVLSSD